jgi:hypothetical protein
MLSFMSLLMFELPASLSFDVARVGALDGLMVGEFVSKTTGVGLDVVSAAEHDMTLAPIASQVPMTSLCFCPLFVRK